MGASHVQHSFLYVFFQWNIFNCALHKQTLNNKLMKLPETEVFIERSTFPLPSYIDEKKTPFDKAYGITMIPTLIKRKEHKISSDIPTAKATNDRREPPLPQKKNKKRKSNATLPLPKRKNVCHFAACSVDFVSAHFLFLLFFISIFDLG